MAATTFLSSEWIDQLWARLRADEAVRTAGATWVYGPLLLIVEADEAASFPETVGLRLDLHEGEARDLRATDGGAAAHVPFAVAGGYGRWKAIFQGADVVDAVLQSRLRLKGDLPALMRHRELLAAVVAAAGTLDTGFPDDVAAGQAEAAGAAR